MRSLKEIIFKKSLTSQFIFRNIVRPTAYHKANQDPERVHELALEALNQYEPIVREIAEEFYFDELAINIAGKKAMPFGTAAGLDKNADAILPLSHIFGFQEVGTIIINPREGNKRPRISVDDKNKDIYNAQGFPSKGLAHTLKNMINYRMGGGKGVILASICGIPNSEHELKVAHSELEKLVDELNPFVDSFVWNPFSPNTAALKSLRTEEEFCTNAKIISQRAGRKLKLVKMGPYDDNQDKKKEWLRLANAFIAGGGDGFVAVNTYMVPKDKIPMQNWGYASAGKSGAFLQPYRQKALQSLRSAFPRSFIIAAGGINKSDEAWKALQYANALEGYSPYTFNGFGIIREMCSGIINKLEDEGYGTLNSYQKLKLNLPPKYYKKL